MRNAHSLHSAHSTNPWRYGSDHIAYALAVRYTTRSHANKGGRDRASVRGGESKRQWVRENTPNTKKGDYQLEYSAIPKQSSNIKKTSISPRRNAYLWKNVCFAEAPCSFLERRRHQNALSQRLALQKYIYIYLYVDINEYILYLDICN